MVKLYDFVKSKEKEIEEGMELIAKTRIEKTKHEDKIIIHYTNLLSTEETNDREGLKYLIVKNNRSIDIFMTFGNIYAPISSIRGYLQEGKRLIKLFNIKELKKADAGNIDHI